MTPGKRYLLDTNALVALLQGHEGLLEINGGQIPIKFQNLVFQCSKRNLGVQLDAKRPMAQWLYLPVIAWQDWVAVLDRQGADSGLFARRRVLSVVANPSAHRIRNQASKQAPAQEQTAQDAIKKIAIFDLAMKCR